MHSLGPGLQLLGGLDPADPLVPGKRRDVLPRRKRRRIIPQRVFQVAGKIMDDAAGNVAFAGHRRGGNTLANVRNGKRTLSLPDQHPQCPWKAQEAHRQSYHSD